MCNTSLKMFQDFSSNNMQELRPGLEGSGSAVLAHLCWMCYCEAADVSDEEVRLTEATLLSWMQKLQCSAEICNTGFGRSRACRDFLL